MCDDNDESMHAPDEYMNTDDCRCKTTCMSLFDSDRIQEHILSVREMEKSEKDLYEEADKAGTRKLGITSFKGIRISGPRDDVCQTCELLRKKIVDAVLEQDKLDASSAFLEHVEVARREREVYRETLKEAADEMSGSLVQFRCSAVRSKCMCTTLLTIAKMLQYHTIVVKWDRCISSPVETCTYLGSINAYVRMYNASGQNKNRCLVDSGFANIKKLFRRCDVDSLVQLAEVVDKSSKSNVPVLYKKTDGSENWAWYF
ncbi:hypothetical protein MAR_018741 [Mya arenaria]|uniref:Uncharacterized protein n=1 Tax=Mya arenaria TaxID=6604 RepID=A0ABY7EJF5_MYAAR|nr:hypothetical protein MAR_018741 [Mya arenaria]